MRIFFLSPNKQIQKNSYSLSNTNPNIESNESSSTTIQPNSPFHMPLPYLDGDYTENNSVDITYNTSDESDIDNQYSSMTSEHELVISEAVIIQEINDQSSIDQTDTSTICSFKNQY